MQQRDLQSAVMKAASVLRNRVLSMEEGTYVGSEDELIDWLGVSRPTFRQSARLLAHEQLLEIKRGVGGGFFVRRPSIDTVSRSVATYLRSRDTSLDQVMDANGGVVAMALRLAIKCRDRAAREKLAALSTRLAEQRGKGESSADLLAGERELTDIIGEMSGNPAIELCLHMFNQFGMDQSSVRIWSHHPRRVSKWSELRLEAIEAILARDDDAAVACYRERGRLVRQWIRRELSGQSRSAATR